MNQYPSNSRKSKEEQRERVPEKKIEKVISGTAKTKKKSEIQKFTDVFVSEDMNSVKSYIVMDVLVPAIKKAISDIVTNGIDMLLYGESDNRNSKKNRASNVSYRSYYETRDNRRDRSIDRGYSGRQAGYNFDNIILDNRGEAEDVLTRMDELIETYNIVSVADFYDLVGVSCNYTDNKYGWTDIRSASVVRTRDGYMIKLPKAMPLD